MSSPDRGMRPPGPGRRRSGWEFARLVLAWIVGGLVLVVVIGYFAADAMIQSAYPPLPDLSRPSGVLSGSLQIEPDAEPSSVTSRLVVSPHAVEAATAGDGLVHLELDVSGGGERRIDVEVGVRWQHSDAMIRPVTALEPGADVRWTLPCAPEVPCEGVLDLTLGPHDDSTQTIDVQWRLVAEVRPPRGTDVSENATVSLSLSEAGR